MLYTEFVMTTNILICLNHYLIENYVYQVLTQSIHNKTMCPNYIFEFRHSNYSLQVYLCECTKIETFIDNHVC